MCLDFPGIMAIYWGPDYTLLYSDAMIPVLGSKHPAALGQPASKVWSEIWDVLRPQFDQVRDSGIGMVLPMQRLDLRIGGRLVEKYFSYSLSPLRDGDGRVAGLFNTAQDLTAAVFSERERADFQTELDAQAAHTAQTRALLQSVTDGTTDLVYVKDLEGRLLHLNASCAAVLSTSISKAIGQTDSAFMAKPEADAIRRADLQVMQSRSTIEVEESIRYEGRDAASARTFLSTKSPWIGEGGELLGVFGISRDITERKAHEDALRELNETLETRVAERTRERDAIWRVSREILVVVNREGRFVSVNPAFERVLGWSPSEASTRHFAELIHESDVEAARAAFAKTLDGRPIDEIDLRFVRKDGGHRWLQWTAVPEGEAIYGVARDLTDAREQAEALATTEAQLRQSQKMEAVGQLTGGIAHDFNNMLSTIGTSLALIRRRAVPEKQANAPADPRVDAHVGTQADLARYLDAAEASVRSAAALTQRLLAFSRRQVLSAHAVSVNTMVADMHDLLARTLGENMALETRLAPQLALAHTDANQLENALLNLCINARDAMPGGGKLTIETELAHLDTNYARQNADVEPGHYVMLCVSDTGVGMPPEVTARAFDPFFTTKPVGQGTGLGLSMIYGFAKQSGGHVAIYSEPERGTSVKLYLPLSEQSSPAETSATEAQRTAPVASGTAVLLVEDGDALRDVVVELLVDSGYVVHEAADAEAALKIIDAGTPFDVLLTDVGLPRINGRQLAEMARARRPGLPVLFLTGYADLAAVRGDFLAAGMEMMSKPFDFDALAAKIAEMVARPVAV